MISLPPGLPERYVPLRELGRGSTGVVVGAHDERHGQPVALKLIELPDDAARQRFDRETAVLARLQHPDIVRTFDSGRSARLGWIAMELLHAVPLARYTEPRWLLPDPVVLRLVERIARALDHAHRRGIVHRDVKPSNVMVDLPSDLLRVTDFGLARLADAEAATGSGLWLGSPAYMAPEVASGAEADARADLYALGVTAFQLLSGAHPQGSGSLGEWLRRLTTEPAQDLRTLRPDLDAALSAWVARLLDRDPGHRPASAGECADELARLREAAAPGTL